MLKYSTLSRAFSLEYPMPKLSTATKESLESVIEISDRVIDDLERSYRYWLSLSRVVNLDGSGRISFRPILLAHRRKLVMKLFTGDNYDDVARHLNVSEKTVRGEVLWNYVQSRKNGKNRR